MADTEGVVLAFSARRKGREPVGLLDGVQSLASTGDHLVRVGLVADVPHDAILRGVEDIVERDREFHGAEAGGEMPAAGRDGFDQEGAQFRRQLLERPRRELAQIRGREDGGRISARANFVVFETLPDQHTSVLCAGRYLDTLVRTAAGLRLREKICVYDAALIPGSIVMPL